jgi:glycosyltransferase involved in cell wall biosynthesis
VDRDGVGAVADIVPQVAAVGQDFRAGIPRGARSRTPLAVLHVVGGAEVGGVERVAAVLASGLHARGHRSRLVVLGKDGPLADAARRAGTDVVVLGVSGFSPRRPVQALRSTLGLLRLARHVAGDWDLVQTHLFRTALAVTPLARLRRHPVVGALHGIDPSARQRRLMRRLLRHQDGAVCASAALRHTLVEQEGFPAARLHVVPNGVATAGPLAAPGVGGPADGSALRQGLGIPPSAPVVACVGRLYPRKGQRRLVAAFRTVARHHPDARLVLAGDGPDREALAADITAYSLGDRVHLLGEVADPGPVLAAADLLAVPSDYEGFGLVVVEAMLAGVPVVASAAGGPCDLIEDGVSGRLVPVTSDGVEVEALAAAVTEALGDAGVRERWTRTARERSSAYTAEAMVLGYEQVYRTVLASRSR